MIERLRCIQVKREGFSAEIEAAAEVLLKFKGGLTLVMTPSRRAKYVYIYDVKAVLCCQPIGKTTSLLL